MTAIMWVLLATRIKSILKKEDLIVLPQFQMCVFSILIQFQLHYLFKGLRKLTRSAKTFREDNIDVFNWEVMKSNIDKLYPS